MIRDFRSFLRVPVFLLPLAALVLLCGPTPAEEATTQPSAADSLGAAIDSLRSQARYGEAVGVARELLSVITSESGVKPYELADAKRLIRALQFAAALPESSRMELGEADRLEAAVYRAYYAGKRADGEQYARRQLEIRRRLLGEEHSKIAESLNTLAALLHARGDYAGAEPLFREALAMQRKLLGKEHPHVAGSLNNLAALLQDRGNFGAAEPLFRESLAMKRRLRGEEHPDVGTGLNNLAKLLDDRGDYAGAEPLYREALAIRRKSYPEGDPRTAASLNNLASVLQYRGDYAGAEPLYRESLAMWRKFLGEEHPNVATNLNNLAALLSKGGDDAGAEALFREALAMDRKLLGQDNLSVPSDLNNLALLLQARGDYAGAEPLFRESLGVWRKLLGEEHPNVTMSLNNLAGLLLVRGEYARAESLFAEAAQSYEAARLRVGAGMARATFLKASLYPALAEARLLLGRESEAWPAVERSQGRVLADLLLTAESRGLSLAETHQEDSLRLVLGDQERQVRAYRAAARTDSSAAARRRVREASTCLLDAEARWSAFEQEIAAKYPVSEGQAFDLARVQAALKPDEAIVGWLDLKQTKGQPRLPSWGYVLRRQGPVEWRQLSKEAVRSEAEDNHSTQSFRFEISQPPTTSRLPPMESRAIHEERFAGLMDCLKGVRYLIIIPSGEMLGIPVEALVDDGGDLVGDRFAVSYVPSATIHTWIRERSAERETAEGPSCLAVGDPPFSAAQLAAMAAPVSAVPATDVSPDSTKDLTFLVPPEKRPAMRGREGFFVRSALAGSRDVLSSLARLPSTREEVQVVARLHGPGSRLLLGPGASEQELARMAKSGELARYRTIHLATHALVDDEQPEISALVLSQVDLPDPYEAAVKGERIYDGLLDAKEIVREWKLDADLVTLSACETGLGKEVVGEGYVGLADAFLQAGTRSLLVSLWRVEDRSTSMLMERFYENWRGGYDGVHGTGHAPGAPLPKVEALQEAKRWLREWKDQRGGRPYQHPYYWAGFVLIGESA